MRSVRCEVVDNEVAKWLIIFSLPETVGEVVSLAGLTAQIPCDIQQFVLGEDRAKLVMWFRNNSETPFYM